jgi:hypothetical protein
MQGGLVDSRLAGFIIDCNTTDLAAAARFWGGALRMEVQALPSEEGDKYMRLVDPEGRLHIEVQRVTHPSRVHLDIEADDVEQEAARLVSLGAQRVEKVNTWWVLEAPTGQRFCVVRAKPAKGALDRWRQVMMSTDRRSLGELLAQDVVMDRAANPEPRRGRAACVEALHAEFGVFDAGSLRFVDAWRAEHSATLEFLATIGGDAANGMHALWWNAKQEIVRIKTFLRPATAMRACEQRGPRS